MRNSKSKVQKAKFELHITKYPQRYILKEYRLHLQLANHQIAEYKSVLKMIKPTSPKSLKLNIRPATPNDIKLILQFINELGAYEKLSHEVVATEEKLHNTLFLQKMAEVIIGECKGVPVGFALFFHNYSTFLGQAGLYLEDLYIKPEVRGKGFGKTMLTYLARLAVERGCGRLEWACLDWNYPSISFYKNLGAKALDEWTVYRVSGETLQKLAEIEMG